MVIRGTGRQHAKLVRRTTLPGSSGRRAATARNCIHDCGSKKVDEQATPVVCVASTWQSSRLLASCCCILFQRPLDRPTDHSRHSLCSPLRRHVRTFSTSAFVRVIVSLFVAVPPPVRQLCATSTAICFSLPTACAHAALHHRPPFIRRRTAF